MTVELEKTKQRFAKLRLNKPQVFWIIVPWTDETKVLLFGPNFQHHDHELLCNRTTIQNLQQSV